MLKSKMIMNVLLVLTVLFCLLPIDSSIAGICDEQREQTSYQLKNRITPATPTITGNYNYPSDWTCPENPSLEYGTANSVETIDRNGSAALVVIGNNGPYTWSVSGTGFTLETEGEPTGATNTLYADGSACGAATITVTGCDGTQVTGYVRCTAGTWELTESCDGRFEPSCSGWSCSSANIIIGKHLYIVGWNVCDQDLFPDCCADPLITGCGHCPDGDAFMEYCEENRCAPCCDCSDICFSTYFQAYEWRCN